MAKFKAFLLTTAVVCLAGFFKLLLLHFLKFESTLLLFFAAVCIAAWYGGGVQGVYGTLLSLTLALYYFIPPFETWKNPEQIWYYRFSLFSFECFIATLICVKLRRSKNEIHSALTELTEVEKSLRKSEERFRKVFDSNMIGMLFCDFEGNILDANDHYLKMVGFTRSEIRNGEMNWKTVTPPESLDASIKALESLKTNEVLPPFEKEYQRKDGTRISVLVGAAKVDETTVVTFILDINERKEAEIALSQANMRLEQGVAQRTKQLTEANRELSKYVTETQVTAERLRESQIFMDSVIENIPNMIFVKDAKDLRFVRFNKAGEELVGHSRSELIGKNDYDFFPHDQAEFFTERDRFVLRGNEVVDIPDEPLQTQKGLRFLHTKKIPIFDKFGKPQYLLGISEDITNKKEAEKQRIELLQEQAARSEAEKSANRLSFLSEASAALNESLDVEAMLNSFARVVIANMGNWCLIDLYDQREQSFDRMVTANRDPMQVTRLEGIRRRYNMDRSPAEGIMNVIRTGQARMYSTIDEDTLGKLLKDPRAAPELMALGLRSCMIVPLKYYGKVFGALTIVSADPTRIYDELDFSIAQDLARRASLAIENAKLFGKANEASQAKSAFLANMSHEIRTPLGAMLGFAELISEGENLTSEQINYVSTVIRNGRQLLRIVDEILDLSKVESDRIQLEKVEFSLSKLMDEVTSLLEMKAKDKGLLLDVTIHSNVSLKVVTDPTRLRQILINVIGNAIKFTEQGTIEVEVALKQQELNPEKNCLEFDIVDTGIGITPEQADKLFQPFAQADGSMTRKFGGTGLGLFLSRKLAKLLGGDVILKESKPREGSHFVVIVEVEAREEVPRSLVKLQDTLEQQVTDERADRPKGRVLIVDDASDNRRLAGLYVASMGWQSDSAENGRKGAEKAMKGNYDVILMDLQMPDMDGFEALKYLREHQYKGPVVALTAHAMKGDKERCLENGFDDYLCKPLTKDAINQSLSKYMSH